MAEVDEPRTLSREELYELVWSKPMLEAAQEFGISDVALAKRCKRLLIPVPGRGYWARVEAGQKPPRVKLLNREDQWGDYRALTMPARPKGTPEQLTHEAICSFESVASLRSRAAALSITGAESVDACAAAVKRTARHLKHPLRAEFAYGRGEKSGPLIPMDVSSAALERACMFADRLLKACEALGWSFVDAPKKTPEEEPERGRYGRPLEPPSAPPQPPPVGEILVAGERVGFQIEERTRDEPREPTPAELSREKREYRYKAPRKTIVPTGNLRVARLDTYKTYGGPTRLSWYDRGSARIEDQLHDILAGFYELALSIKTRRADDEREQRAREEAERRRKEIEARQQANAKLVEQFETDAGAWHRARYLRRYIAAARRALGSQSIPVSFQNQQIDYLAWAEKYVDQLDPLRRDSRSMEFEKRSGHFMNDLDRLKDAFGRLLGGEWESAWKLGEDYKPSADSLYYHQRSVFEVSVQPITDRDDE